MTGQAANHIRSIATLSAEGFTRAEIATKTGLTYSYIVRLALDAGIEISRQKYSGAETGDSIRISQMAELYRNGRTLKQIGNRFGITRERVRQILTKHLGFTKNSGGSHVRAEQQRLRSELKRDQRSLKKWGCNWAQYADLKAKQKPTRAYASQRNNARTRGIEWNLTLWEWWSIWQRSGHWENRGRGRGFQMCRIGDQGSYSIDNVYIASGAINIQDYWADVKSGVRTRTLSPRAFVSPEASKKAQRAAVDRYRSTPKFKLRHQLRRQGIPKEQRDAIVAQKFGDAR